jgi:hypothetical protein
MDTYRKVTIKAEMIFAPKVYGEDEFINEIEIFNISRGGSLLLVEEQIVLAPKPNNASENADYKIKLSAGNGCVFSHPIKIASANNAQVEALVIRKLYDRQ